MFDAAARPDDGNVIDLAGRRSQRRPEVPEGLPFGVSSSQNDGCVTVCLTGELDIATTPELEGALIRTLNGRSDGGREIRLDLGDLTFVDVAGVRALCRCLELVEAHGTGLAVEGLRPHVRRVLEMCGKLELFEPLMDRA